MKPDNRRRHGKKGPINGPWADNTAGWFAVGYGPFRRLYGASPEAQRLMSGPSRVARLATMFKEDATLSECELWLKELDYRKLESKLQEARVLDQTIRLLNDDFLRNGLRVERIDSEGLWLRDCGGTTLPLADMSEGYRAALALMIDIMRHLDEAYPGSDLISMKNGNIVVPHRGVALIDEVDAHLHPGWQRNIGNWLKTRFPNFQFIVTSHSALVCQAGDL
ncbi:MAG: AAA family ATPase, partial [bacterium]|nr:AAA family ATPase [bacterium]